MWTDPVDIYCERTGPEFWSEPVNAVTNLAFIVAACFIWYTAQNRRVGAILAVLVGLIGVGSFLNHTVAQRWAAMSDTLSIALFIVVALWCAGRRIAHWSPLGAGVFLVAFFATAGLGATYMPRVINGGEAYLVPILSVFLFAGIAYRSRREKTARRFLLAGLLLAFSLTARTVDASVCDVLPVGTHFLWHVLNGAALALIGISLAARRV